MKKIRSGRRSKLGRQRVTAHVIEHSNADSITHARDKVAFDKYRAQELADRKFAEDTTKIAERILLFSDLSRLDLRYGPNRYWIARSGGLQPTTGADYELCLKKESQNRTHYRVTPRSKPDDIGKDSGLTICTMTVLSNHTVYLRTQPLEAQEELLFKVAASRARQIETITGWLVLGCTLHNDTAGIHFDFMLSRYSAPEPPLPGTRQRIQACRLLGDRQGLRKVGPRVVGYFRMAADRHKSSAKPGLGAEARRKYKAHLSRYHREKPLDLLLSLALDKEIRDMVGHDPNFHELRSEWYQCRDAIMREDETRPLIRLLQSGTQDPSVAAVVTILEAYIAKGASGIEARLQEYSTKAVHSSDLAQRLEATEATLTDRTQRVVELENAHEATTKNLEEVAQKLVTHEATVLVLTKGIEGLREQLRIEKADTTAAKERIATLDGWNATLRANATDLANKVRKTETAKREEVEEWKARLMKKDREFGKLGDSLSTLRAEQELKCRELEQAKKRVENLRSVNLELHGLGEARRKDLEKMTGLESEQRERLGATKKELDKRSEELAAVQNELKLASERNTSLSEQLKELKESNQIPEQFRTFALLDAKADEVVAWGTWANCQSAVRSRKEAGANSETLIAVDISGWPAWKLGRAYSDRSFCKKAIDEGLKFVKPKAQVLAAHFPNLSMETIATAIQSWTVESLANLRILNERNKSAVPFRQPTREAASAPAQADSHHLGKKEDQLCRG